MHGHRLGKQGEWLPYRTKVHGSNSVSSAASSNHGQVCAVCLGFLKVFLCPVKTQKQEIKGII